MNIDQQESLLTEREVSQLLGIKQRTLQQWRLTRRGPKFVKLTCRVIRYRLSDVNDWLQLSNQKSS